MSAGMDYTGRHRNDDGPRADTTMVALHDALDTLSLASLTAETAETAEAARTDGLLADAELIAAGFAPGSKAARGLLLLTGAIRDAKEAAA